MRSVVGSLVLLLVLGGSVRGEDGPDARGDAASKVVCDALQSETKAALVAHVLSDPAKAAELSRDLAGSPSAVQRVSLGLLTRAAPFAALHGDDATAFAGWARRVADEAVRLAPTSLSARHSQGFAAAAVCRVSEARKTSVLPAAWVEAAQILTSSYDLGKDKGLALTHALDLLCYAGKLPGPSASVLEQARLTALRARAEFPGDEGMTLVVAKSYRAQAEAHVATNRRLAQDAAREFFATMRGLDRDGALGDVDVADHNSMVTWCRSNKVDVGSVDYVSRMVFAANGILSMDLPISGNWRVSEGGTLDQSFASPKHRRSLSFSLYSWNMVYGDLGTGGDNAKGIANALFERTLKDFTSVTKKSPPTRKSWNSRLPSGLEFTVEGNIARRPGARRVRVFVAKATAAQTTFGIHIEESLVTPTPDPEFDDVIASLEVAKARR